MAISVERQAKIWGIAALLFLLVLWLLGNVILPFLIGGALAYLLDPIADRLTSWGMRRVWAVIIITLSALLALTLAILLLIPMLVDQATALVRITPTLIGQVTDWLTQRFPELMEETSPVRQQLADAVAGLQARTGELVNRLLSGAMGVLNWLLIIIIVPVVTFYLLLDWDHMIARLDELLPRDHAPTIRVLAHEIDATLAGFIRGQALVCLILGTYYALALMAVGLNFGLVVGAIAGALTFIPYVGALVGGVLAIGLALFQFWGHWIWVIVVWAIFQSGQFVEGNFLTPKLVGDRVGVHPVWLLFALSAFGALFGFVGVLVAVPLAAVIGVLVRFAIGKYKQSHLYQGNGGIPLS
ncbi:putative permease [Rubellimicrobium thermophilum DSM 16684]|uniref:Putative permease n=1 Tax=Rubellimicrobium thermophilum DSM 16684 TaxID=1123069 RepID=S9R3Y2_9RHOB|nr:AI-2E family transporter [Rubellimicrobium thermophilum]EPX86602.1 putative permease [Rubellimicrobium thermophilum DSM 16684]